VDLEPILCEEEDRTVAPDNTVSFGAAMVAAQESGRRH
jgi:hypothetical protein